MLKSTGIILGLAIAITGAATFAVSSGVNAAGHKAGVVKKAVVNGKVLFTNPKGHTLYTFDKDTDGVSNCNGGCAKKWPPVKAKVKGMMAGDYTVIERKDGSLQWAYKGHPLYTWFKDTRAGQTSGDGVKGVWHVARPY